MGVVEAAVHDADGADGDGAEDADGEHDFDESVAFGVGFHVSILT